MVAAEKITNEYIAYLIAVMCTFNKKSQLLLCLQTVAKIHTTATKNDNTTVKANMVAAMTRIPLFHSICRHICNVISVPSRMWKTRRK